MDVDQGIWYQTISRVVQEATKGQHWGGGGGAGGGGSIQQVAKGLSGG